MREGMNNFFDVFTNWRYILLFLVLFSLMNWFFMYFSNLELTAGNYGMVYVWIELFFQISISFLFATFVSGTLFRFVEFNNFAAKETTISTIGSFFGVLAAGCLSCSVTFATYLGFASVLAVFPWGGLELKAIGLILLIYTNYSLFTTLHTCKVKIKK